MNRLKSISSKLIIAFLAVLISGGVASALTLNGSVDEIKAFLSQDNPAPVQDQAAMGGSRQISANPNFPDGLSINDVTENYVQGTIELQEYQKSFCNKTDRTVFFDYAEAYINGTASSTLTLDIATSSTATLAYNASPFSELIDSYSITTSTTYKLVNSIKNAGTNGINSIAVTAEECLVFFLQNPYSSGASCTGSLCENATSTARGYTVNYKARYHYIE